MIGGPSLKYVSLAMYILTVSWPFGISLGLWKGAADLVA